MILSGRVHTKTQRYKDQEGNLRPSVSVEVHKEGIKGGVASLS